MTEINRDDYLTTGQVARLAAVSSESIRRWCDDGRLPHVLTASGRRLVLKTAAEKLRPTES